jgi:predicted N-acetyltransferase YhbS
MRFAWISMVLVTAAYRRQGLARRLLRRCVDDLTAGGLVPVLDATPAGHAVYVALGFNDTWGFQRLTCRQIQPTDQRASLPSGIVIRRITDADWPQLCRYDAASFGADRTVVLGRLRGRAPSLELVAYRGDSIVGFTLGRGGRSATQIGPLVAEDEVIARALLDHGLGAISGPAYVDLADSKTPLHDWLLARGFEVQRPLTRMVHGRTESFDDPLRTFAVAGPELG